MSHADEFAKWLEILSKTADEAVAELSLRAMEACVQKVEAEEAEEADTSSTSLGEGIAWAAFWLTVGAVLVAYIVTGHAS